MIRSIALLVFACAAGSAHAATFQVTAQIIAVAPGEHSQELTLSLLPNANMVGAQIDITMNLDRFGWVQAVPSTPAAGITKECAIVNGAVRGLVVSSTSFDPMYSIPVCRIRVRPHKVTPLGNYYTSYANGTTVRLDGTTTPASANSVRIIVDD